MRPPIFVEEGEEGRLDSQADIQSSKEDYEEE